MQYSFTISSFFAYHEPLDSPLIPSWVTTSHSQVIQYNSSFVILGSIYAHIHHMYFKIHCIPLHSDKNRHMEKKESIIAEGSA